VPSEAGSGRPLEFDSEDFSAPSVPAASREEESHVGIIRTHHHVVGAREGAPVDVDRETPRSQRGESVVHATFDLVVRGARTLCLAHGKCYDVPEAQWRGYGKDPRSRGGYRMYVERNPNANHPTDFWRTSRSRLPLGSRKPSVSIFGAHDAAAIADAADKFISKMDEDALLRALQEHVSHISDAGRISLADSMLDAFRGRGESSEDVAEACGVHIDSVRAGDAAAFTLLLRYAAENNGLVKEAVASFVETQPERLRELPAVIVDGITARLTGA